MKILVTGGCGFLGSNIASSFLDDSHSVFLIDSLYRKGSSANLQWLQSRYSKSQLKFFQIDISDAHLVEDIFSSYGPFDYVCHLAGQVAMTTSLLDPRRDFNTNALGTFNILEAVRKHSPSSFLAYSSTNKVYGDLEFITTSESESRYYLPSFPDGLDESLKLDFSTPYGCSKGAADQYVHDWSRIYGLKTVVFRHSSIYGGRQFSTSEQGWVGWFCAQALSQSKQIKSGQQVDAFTVSGTGKQVRDILHADDLIRLYKLAYQHRNSISGHIFNIGGGISNSISLLELFSLLSDKLACGPLLFKHIPRRESDQDFFVACNSKITTLSGWAPEVTIENGIERMLQWINELST